MCNHCLCEKSLEKQAKEREREWEYYDMVSPDIPFLTRGFVIGFVCVLFAGILLSGIPVFLCN
jgi:hypothetical protein